MSITVTTQAELDAATKAGETHIEIRSPHGVWLRVTTPRSTSVEARGSASVEARGSASVEARDSASVEAWDSASVEARDSASVEAWDSASVEARGSASVVAWGSASVEARDSASVVARDSASVVAWDSASVEAWGSASVEAWGSASVVARDSASVEATPHVAIHLHSANATIEGGVIIDVTQVNKTAESWCEHHGITVTGGIATVYKAVSDTWTTDRGFDYSPGATPEAPDWNPAAVCGGGLHFGPSPRHSRDYFPSATRYVEVGVAVADMVPIGGGGGAKCKAPRVVRPCVEVDLSGKPIVAPKVTVKAKR